METSFGDLKGFVVWKGPVYLKCRGAAVRGGAHRQHCVDKGLEVRAACSVLEAECWVVWDRCGPGGGGG